MENTLIHDGKLERDAAAAALREFLQKMMRVGNFDVNVVVRTLPADADAGPDGAEVFADIDGRDKELLLARNAEVLKAVEHLAFRALGLDTMFHEKVHIDCGGYRALRLEELRMTARVAAERVQASGQPFRLNPMPARERRVVHLALKDMPGVRTESVGTGEERQVVIHRVEKTAEGKR